MCKALVRRLAKNAAALAADSRGNIAVATALLLPVVLLLAGGATDVALYEVHRVELQDALDRASLAAASLSQQVDPKTVVTDYMADVSFIKGVNLKVDVDQSSGFRKLTIDASYAMSTNFLSMIGITSMNMDLRSSAQESRQNIEISLMLDMSGSMRYGTPSKISLLKPAAQGFIDSVLNDDTKTFTTVSLIPYAGSVSVGRTFFDMVGGARAHTSSSCFEFNDGEYGVSALSFTQRKQVPHFTAWNYNTKIQDLNWWWCPSDDTSITFISNDAQAIKNRIAGYKMHDGTGSAIAMNWGFELLNPTFRTYAAQAVSAGLIPQSFAQRPAAFDDKGTLKFLVLMTDGEISDQLRPKDTKRSVDLAPDNTVVLSAATALKQLLSVCSAAKDQGVTIFTIGFQVNDAAQAQMKQCATDANHYYNVSGLDIGRAFQSIASTIATVRLTE